MSAAVGSSNISLSGLRTAYNNGGLDDADDDSGLNAGTSNTSLDDFRTANFTDSSSVPAGSAAISIGTHFRNKTFGSAATTYYLRIHNDSAMSPFFYTITDNSGAFVGGTSATGAVTAFGNSGQLEFLDANGSITLTITNATGDPLVNGEVNQALSATTVSPDLTYTGSGADGVGTLAWDEGEGGADGSPSTINIAT